MGIGTTGRNPLFGIYDSLGTDEGCGVFYPSDREANGDGNFHREGKLPPDRIVGTRGCADKRCPERYAFVL